MNQKQVDETERSALLPCPFCGASAMLQQCPAKGFRPAGTRITFQVGCSNRDFNECPFRPFAADFDFPSERQAVAAWNTRPSAWLPIDSVPKDGTKVLIFVSSDDDGECHKIAYWSSLAARPGWFYRGGWCEENETDGWMPLPTAPEQKETKDDR